MTAAKAWPAKSMARLAGALAICVGSLVLVGWALDLAALKGVLSSWVIMSRHGHEEVQP